MGRTEDLVLVLLQSLDPRTHVRGVMRWIVGHSDFGSNKDARQLGTKFFFRVIQIAESIGFVQGRALEPRGVTGPVCEFVKRCAVVTRRVFEGFFRRQVNAVCGRTIERAVALVVRDFRAGVGEDTLTALNGFEFCRLPALEGWYALDLLRVEDGVNPMSEAAMIFLGGFVAAVLALDRKSVV